MALLSPFVDCSFLQSVNTCPKSQIRSIAMCYRRQCITDDTLNKETGNVIGPSLTVGQHPISFQEGG